MKTTCRTIAIAAALALLVLAGERGQYFFHDFKAGETAPAIPAGVEATRLVNLDPTRSAGAPNLDLVWLWKGSAKDPAEVEHVHDYDEFMGLIGTRGPDDPHGLGGEVEVWLGGEKYTITRSCLIYAPKGLKHGPIRFTRIDTPVLFLTGGLGAQRSRSLTEFQEAKSAERDYAKYISYGVNPEKTSAAQVNKWAEMRKKTGSAIEATRLLDLDGVEGAPYVDFVWLWKGFEKGPNHSEHAHDWGEVFGFIGARGKESPRELGGEIELWVGGEKRLIRQSCLVWAPPGLKHCPMQFNRIDSPVLVFTMGATRKYTLTPSAKNP